MLQRLLMYAAPVAYSSIQDCQLLSLLQGHSLSSSLVPFCQALLCMVLFYAAPNSLQQNDQLLICQFKLVCADILVSASCQQLLCVAFSQCCISNLQQGQRLSVFLSSLSKPAN